MTQDGQSYKYAGACNGKKGAAALCCQSSFSRIFIAAQEDSKGYHEWTWGVCTDDA